MIHDDFMSYAIDSPLPVRIDADVIADGGFGAGCGGGRTCARRMG